MTSKSDTGKRPSSGQASQTKKIKTTHSKSYFRKTLEDSGLILKNPPEKCIAVLETIHIVRNLKKNIQNHIEYPRNVSELYSILEKEFEDMDMFKHCLFPNTVRVSEDGLGEPHKSDSVIKILLSIPVLQSKLIDYIFEKAIDLAADSKCAPWIQMILKCMSSLDSIVDTEKLSTNLINLLDITSEKMVRLEVITAIPDIVGDQEHNNIAAEISRILCEDNDLIPACLDCLSYLCLSDEQYEQLQKKTLNILTILSNCSYFPNFVKFVLMPGRMSDNAYLEAVQGLRNALGWSTSLAKPQDIATSQVLTVAAIRNSMVSSKVTANAWLKAISSCKVHTDHKPFDIILLLILYSTTEDKQRQVENLFRKHIKLNLFKEDLLDECFEKFKPILKDNLKNLINLTNVLQKTKNDPLVESFAAHIYTLMFSHLEECCQTIVAELLQLGLECMQSMMNILVILNNVASKNMSLLKPQSLQMLTLLDKMDNMTLDEIRAVMDLVCGLAYSFENSEIRDDIHMIIGKELSNLSPIIKIQGILAGIYAVKYLMNNNTDEDQSLEIPDNVSYGTLTHLSDGDLREAAQIIELISRSTKQFPDMIALFYDELSKIISTSSHINKHFMSWLTDAVTNDLQQNFIVDSIENERIKELKLSMQYCLNADSEMDEMIAINIAGLALKSNDDLIVGILSPLFQLVQTLHSRQYNGNLSSIDALLGCPIVMPDFNIDLIEDMDHTTVSNILDCLIYCTNWFRELLNAFSLQNDEVLKAKILKRVMQIEELESLICQVLLTAKIAYKPPSCTFDVKKYTGDLTEKKTSKLLNTKQKTQKKIVQDDTTELPETIKTQATQMNALKFKNRLDILLNIPVRPLSMNIMNLFNADLVENNELEENLTIKSLKFLLKCVNYNLEKVLISKIKRVTFLSKQEDSVIYDPKRAEECAKYVSKMLPKMMEHLMVVISYIESHNTENSQNGSDFMFSSEMMDYLSCLEYFYDMFGTYFKWIGFKDHHNALLKTSLRTIGSTKDSSVVNLKDLILNAAKNFQKHAVYCLQLSTAVSLTELVKTIQDYSEDKTILKILRDLAETFLSQNWKTPEGIPEKGVIYNQSVDRLAGIYLINNEILALKNLTLQLTNDIKVLKGRNDTLNSFKCINKSNFPILFRNLGTALHECTKARLNKGLTNCEHLSLWKDVATILKYMSDIAKTLETRNNLSAFFKRTIPIIRLFISQGIPIIELQFKNDTQEVLEILKVLQQSTRFLQTLCCHSRLKKDTVLMKKVPFMRQLLETLIYKVKAALAANKCSEAFWMGNLKNKDIHGEVISTQQSIESEESVEDGDHQLPEEEASSEDTDDEVINPESNSVSDIL